MSNPSNTQSAHKGRILLVEDDDITVFAVQAMLDQLGYQHEAVMTKQAAIEIIRTQRFDFVLLDVGLGDDRFGGMEVLQQLQDLEPFPRIALFTARAEDSLKDEALKLGAVAYIRKPVTYQQLDQRLSELVSTV